MDTNSLPFVLTHIEELMSRLKSEFQNVVLHMKVELMFYDGDDRNIPYKVDVEEEKIRIYDLLDKFRDECKSNFLLKDDKDSREKYYHLLNKYFGFFSEQGTEIKKYMDEFWERFDVDHDTGVYNSIYHHSLNDWANFLTQDVLDEVQEIFDLYNSYGANTIVSFRNDKPVIHAPIQESEPTEPGVKLKWKCSPAIAGYIISELIRTGYVEPPITNGELSYAKLAGICNQIFDIRSDGKLTTLDYLKKVVNPESNQLPDYKRAKLNLPDLDQLT